MNDRDLRRWLGFRTVRTLLTLLPEAQVGLSGRPPVRIDGQTLDPGLQLSLALLKCRATPRMETLPPPEARRLFRRQSAATKGPPTAVGAVRDLRVTGAAGPLAARHYAPEEGEGRPLILYFHGGGFVVGDLETTDETCRLLCRHAGSHVVSVDYRLAPEHRFPAAVEDAWAALRWSAAHAAMLGADPERVTVAGDSAGGNLAAGAAGLAAREGGPTPAAQLLFYPATDAVGDYRSQGLFDDGFLLDRGLIEWFVAQYVGAADTSDPRLSVLRAGDPSNLPRPSSSPPASTRCATRGRLTPKLSRRRVSPSSSGGSRASCTVSAAWPASAPPAGTP